MALPSNLQKVMDQHSSFRGHLPGEFRDHAGRGSYKGVIWIFPSLAFLLNELNLFWGDAPLGDQCL